nr:Gfo/Idh/MocA family oxidoreductase [Aggregatibacter actinomycetemcomitans]
MKQVRIGLVGTGYIGRCHAIAYAQAPTVFPLDAKLVLEYLAEVTPELAEKKAKEFGFKRFTGDWRDIVQDPNVDVVDICTPNFLHKDIALAAIANGKHVYSEKPLALTAADAKLMYKAAKKAGVKTLVGFNYIKNPTTQLAREIIAKGEIGEVIHFYGTHNEDYLANENTPLDWHCVKEKAGLGTLGDLAAHIVQMSQYLLGQEIRVVIGDMQTVIQTRPNPNSLQERLTVENEDQASAVGAFRQWLYGND